jgi:magnesium and cobalt transporter
MNDEQNDPPSRRPWLERIRQIWLKQEPEDKDALLKQLRDARRRHILDSDALSMIEGVLEVAEMRVRDIMIPRSQMVVIEVDTPLPALLNEVIESGHSRFPVIDDDRDDIVGVLIVKDLLRYFAEGGSEPDLRDLLRPAKFIPESKRLNVLLKEFRATRLHMAMVVDEYGGVAGLVTIEDVLEQIVGEIDDEHDEISDEDYIRDVGHQRFYVMALTPVEDFNAHFGARLSDEKADTVGGLVMMELGHLPKRGEAVNVEGYNFRVVRSDNRRLHMLELSNPPAGLETGEQVA